MKLESEENLDNQMVQKGVKVHIFQLSAINHTLRGFIYFSQLVEDIITYER